MIVWCQVFTLRLAASPSFGKSSVMGGHSKKQTKKKEVCCLLLGDRGRNKITVYGWGCLEFSGRCPYGSQHWSQATLRPSASEACCRLFPSGLHGSFPGFINKPLRWRNNCLTFQVSAAICLNYCQPLASDYHGDANGSPRVRWCARQLGSNWHRGSSGFRSFLTCALVPSWKCIYRVCVCV